MAANGTQIVERIDSALRKKGEADRVQLLKVAGLNSSTVSSWVTRGTTPKTDDAIKIARYLGVSVEWLIFGEEPPQKEEGYVLTKENRNRKAKKKQFLL